MGTGVMGGRVVRLLESSIGWVVTIALGMAMSDKLTVRGFGNGAFFGETGMKLRAPLTQLLTTMTYYSGQETTLQAARPVRRLLLPMNTDNCRNVYRYLSVTA